MARCRQNLGFDLLAAVKHALYVVIGSHLAISGLLFASASTLVRNCLPLSPSVRSADFMIASDFTNCCRVSGALLVF